MHPIEKVLYMKGVDWSSESSPEYGIYTFPQSLISTNTNHPFFVASPKLFRFQSKNVLRLEPIGKTYFKQNGNKIWSKEGISKVVSGIKTGGNSKYIFEWEDKINLILSEKEIKNLSEDEKENGINNIKCFVRFEMGEDSSTEDGYLPCYQNEKTKFCIEWSYEKVNKMKSEAHSDLANKEFRFLPLNSQISFSTTGKYAPTFRRANSEIFLNKSSRIFFDEKVKLESFLGSLNSKLTKFFCKVISNHTVEFGIEDLKSVSIIPSIENLNSLVSNIILAQNQNPQYDYASHEQLEIDALAYQAYGLNWAEIREVENWYERRYGKLVAAQKRNLATLGKPTDYVEIYKGILGEEI